MIIRMVDNIRLPRVFHAEIRTQTNVRSTQKFPSRQSVQGRAKVLTFQRRAGAIKPSARWLIEKRRKHVAHAGVIRVEPGDLVLRHQSGLDESSIDRRQGQGLETIKRLL